MEHHTKIPKKIIREKLPIEGLVSAFADLWYPQCIEPWFDHQKTEKKYDHLILNIFLSDRGKLRATFDQKY
jgi:hypothetical protein